eukprot:g351.t1
MPRPKRSSRSTRSYAEVEEDEDEVSSFAPSEGEDEFVPDAEEEKIEEEDYIPDNDVVEDDDDDFVLEEVTNHKKKKPKTKKKTTVKKKTKKKKTPSKSSSASSSSKKKTPPPATKKRKKNNSSSSSSSSKKKKMSIKEAAEYVRTYLRSENRPLNAIAVYENTGKLMPKTKLVGLLDDLATKSGGGVSLKKYGKQVVYFADQDQFEDATTEKMTELEEIKKSLETAIQDAKRKLNESRRKHARLSQEPTEKELGKILPELNKEVEELQRTVDRYRASGQKVDPAAKESILKNVEKYRKTWKARRTAAMDVVNQFAEGADKKPKEIINMVGLETDEEYNVSLKAF